MAASGPPSRGPVIVASLLLGPLGALLASRSANKARQGGWPTQPYWTAFFVSWGSASLVGVVAAVVAPLLLASTITGTTAAAAGNSQPAPAPATTMPRDDFLNQGGAGTDDSSTTSTGSSAGGNAGTGVSGGGTAISPELNGFGWSFSEATAAGTQALVTLQLGQPTPYVPDPSWQGTTFSACPADPATDVMIPFSLQSVSTNDTYVDGTGLDLTGLGPSSLPALAAGPDSPRLGLDIAGGGADSCSGLGAQANVAAVQLPFIGTAKSASAYGLLILTKAQPPAASADLATLLHDAVLSIKSTSGLTSTQRVGTATITNVTGAAARNSTIVQGWDLSLDGQ